VPPQGTLRAKVPRLHLATTGYTACEGPKVALVQGTLRASKVALVQGTLRASKVALVQGTICMGSEYDKSAYDSETLEMIICSNYCTRIYTCNACRIDYCQIEIVLKRCKVDVKVVEIKNSGNILCCKVQNDDYLNEYGCFNLVHILPDNKLSIKKHGCEFTTHIIETDIFLSLIKHGTLLFFTPFQYGENQQNPMFKDLMLQINNLGFKLTNTNYGAFKCTKSTLTKPAIKI
jgi:hypothetical protein